MRTILGFVIMGLVTPGANAIEPVEKPTNIYAVVAGVLQWPGNKLSGFSTKLRKDKELYDTLLARGVPAKNMRLLLDEQSTQTGIRKAIRDITASAPVDATFLFYYCGHGFSVKNDDVCFANYDLDSNAPLKTGLLTSNIGTIIGRNYRGKRVLLMADCCCSGGLAETAKALSKSGFEAAALTSADAVTVSTGNWTFTQSIIDSLKGDALADTNHDGTVTLGEMAGEVREAMRVLERQKSQFTTNGLNVNFPVSAAKVNRATVGKTPFQLGQYVIAPDDNRKRPGRIIHVADGKYGVAFYDYSDRRQIEVSAKDLLPIPSDWGTRVKVRKAEIQVEWKGTWYPAAILKKDGAKIQIHYVDFDETWDEWVTADRIRPLKK